MPDTLLISAVEFSANFARYEAEASGAVLVKIVRDGRLLGATCLLGNSPSTNN
jgi:hypothetical protein